MSEPQGNFKMRYIGRPNGKLMKGSPGNYIHEKIYNVPFRYSKFAFWELLEPVPKLNAPDATSKDSVYEEEENIYVPAEEELELDSAFEYTLSAPINVDTYTKEIADNYKRQGYTLLDADNGIFVEPPKGEDELEEKEEVEVVSDREELMKALDEAGVEYNKRSRTETLIKLVEGLTEEER